MGNNLRCLFPVATGAPSLSFFTRKSPMSCILTLPETTRKKDYTRIMNILDDALQGFNIRRGHMQIRKQRNKKMGFAHKLTSPASMSQNQARRMDSTSSIS